MDSVFYRLNRANQSYNFPILLSDELLPNAIFYGTVVPLISFYCLKTLVINPYNRRQSEKEKQKLRTANRNIILERRKEAEAVISLMRESYARIMDREIEKKGLVIVRALYGLESVINEYKDNEDLVPSDVEAFEVVIPLQCLVNPDSTLTLTDASKAQLPGFYDPSMGDEKKLFIKYKFEDNLHQVFVDDSKPIFIPSKGMYHSIVPLFRKLVFDLCLDLQIISFLRNQLT